MIKMGILTLIPHDNRTYFDEIAKHANTYQIELYLFSPLSIEPTSQTVNGLYFDSNKQNWINKEFPIPEFLYDRCLYGEDRKSKESQAIVSWLKARKDITFLGYGLPNKWILYEMLMKNPSLSPYLPSTKKCAHPEKILEELNTHNEIILKPINGAHGYAVYSLQLKDKKIIVKTTKQGKLIEKQFEDVKQSVSWLERLLTKQIFLIQPRLDNFNNRKEPFDLRVFLQKDSKGQWQEKARAIRTGEQDGLLTNISAGANVQSYRDWKNTTSSFNHDYLASELDEVISMLPHTLEKMFHPLFELGIDIIVGSDQSIWILDMNSKPGRKIVQLTNPSEMDSLYTAPLAYCQFLASTVREGSKN